MPATTTRRRATTPPPPAPGSASADRDLRYRDLVPADRFHASEVAVVGLGAIGRQVALALAAMGHPGFRAYDFDTVEAVNMGPQGYAPDDVGLPKADACRAACGRLNPDAAFEFSARRFAKTDARGWGPGTAVFCCVDTMSARQLVWAAARAKGVGFFGDVRMAGETLRVLAALPGDAHYETTLFSDDEAFQGRCTAQTTLYGSLVAVGLVLSAYAKALRGEAPPKDVRFSLTAMDVSVLD